MASADNPDAPTDYGMWGALIETLVNETSCSICCMEQTVESIPMRLPCGHMLCHPCLTRILAPAQKAVANDRRWWRVAVIKPFDQEAASCPFCRVPIAAGSTLPVPLHHTRATVGRDLWNICLRDALWKAKGKQEELLREFDMLLWDEDVFRLWGATKTWYLTPMWELLPYEAVGALMDGMVFQVPGQATPPEQPPQPPPPAPTNRGPRRPTPNAAPPRHAPSGQHRRGGANTTPQQQQRPNQSAPPRAPARPAPRPRFLFELGNMLNPRNLDLDFGILSESDDEPQGAPPAAPQTPPRPAPQTPPATPSASDSDTTDVSDADDADWEGGRRGNDLMDGDATVPRALRGGGGDLFPIPLTEVLADFGVRGRRPRPAPTAHPSGGASRGANRVNPMGRRPQRD